MDGSAAQSIYRLEKERAMQERRLSHTQLMAEAKEAFNKLLADAQLARKGGRPRTNPLPPGAANRPPVKPAVVTVASATVPVKVVKAVTKMAAPAKAVSAKKAVATKTGTKAPARRTTDRGLVKAVSTTKTGVKASAKKGAKPSPRAASKRAKPTPKQSIRGKRGR